MLIIDVSTLNKQTSIVMTDKQHHIQDEFEVFIVTVAGMLYMININNIEILQQCSMISHH